MRITSGGLKHQAPHRCLIFLLLHEILDTLNQEQHHCERYHQNSDGSHYLLFVNIFVRIDEI